MAFRDVLRRISPVGPEEVSGPYPLVATEQVPRDATPAERREIRLRLLRQARAAAGLPPEPTALQRAQSRVLDAAVRRKLRRARD